jgi:hypothetical protein
MVTEDLLSLKTCSRLSRLATAHQAGPRIHGSRTPPRPAPRPGTKPMPSARAFGRTVWKPWLTFGRVPSEPPHSGIVDLREETNEDRDGETIANRGSDAVADQRYRLGSDRGSPWARQSRARLRDTPLSTERGRNQRGPRQRRSRIPTSPVPQPRAKHPRPRTKCIRKRRWIVSARRCPPAGR